MNLFYFFLLKIRSQVSRGGVLVKMNLDCVASAGGLRKWERATKKDVNAMIGMFRNVYNLHEFRVEKMYEIQPVSDFD